MLVEARRAVVDEDSSEEDSTDTAELSSSDGSAVENTTGAVKTPFTTVAETVTEEEPEPPLWVVAEYWRHGLDRRSVGSYRTPVGGC